MKYWITADTHLGHKNIVKFCNRPDNHDCLIVERLGIMKAGDILIHLGDVAFNDEGEREYMSKLYEIGVMPWLVLGNHDRSMSYHLKTGWAMVCHELKIKRYGRVISFSHKPTPTYNCDIQIHGHFHNADPERWEGDLKSYINTRHRLLAIEYSNYFPISLQSAVDTLIRTREMI